MIKAEVCDATVKPKERKPVTKKTNTKRIIFVFKRDYEEAYFRRFDRCVVERL